MESFLSMPERPTASNSRVHPPAKEHESEFVLLVTSSVKFNEDEMGG
jgi:hypothetical protein